MAITQLARRSRAGMSGTWGRPVVSRAQEKSPGARPGLGRDVSKGKRLGLSPSKAVAKSAERPAKRIALQIRRRHVLCPAQRVALVIHSPLAQCLISVAAQGVDVGDAHQAELEYVWGRRGERGKIRCGSRGPLEPSPTQIPGALTFSTQSLPPQLARYCCFRCH
jgi:hypothetical protein